MDALAKRIALHQISSLQPISAFLPTYYGLGTIFCKGHWISSNVQKSLYNTILHSKLLNYLSSKIQFPSHILQNQIDWLVLSRARRECRSSMKIFFTKWYSKTIPTWSVLFQRKQRVIPSYPLCNHPLEDLTHIIQCQAK